MTFPVETFNCCGFYIIILSLLDSSPDSYEIPAVCASREMQCCADSFRPWACNAEVTDQPFKAASAPISASHPNHKEPDIKCSFMFLLEIPSKWIDAATLSLCIKAFNLSRARLSEYRGKDCPIMPQSIFCASSFPYPDQFTALAFFLKQDITCCLDWPGIHFVPSKFIAILLLQISSAGISCESPSTTSFSLTFKILYN